MPYVHLTSFERGRIQALREEGKSMEYVAEQLGRNVSTIQRELTRNRSKNGYDAQKAQRRYEQRRKACRPTKKLDYRPLWDYLIARITTGWTPEEVSGRLALAYPDDPGMRMSHEAIYQAIYIDARLHFLIGHLPQARPKRRKRGQGKTRRGPSIPNRVGIEERPDVVEDRSRYGDWEGDLIVGANQQGFLVTLVERKSLLVRIRKVQSRQAEEVAAAVIEMMLDLPISWVKTITFDNGPEFAQHERIAEVLPLDVYFADPYASYQRGTNENTNGLIRRYLPKGTDFTDISQDYLDHIAEELNNRPRKKLGYRTPNEVFLQQRTAHRLALSA